MIKTLRGHTRLAVLEGSELGQNGNGGGGGNGEGGVIDWTRVIQQGTKNIPGTIPQDISKVAGSATVATGLGVALGATGIGLIAIAGAGAIFGALALFGFGGGRSEAVYRPIWYYVYHDDAGGGGAGARVFLVDSFRVIPTDAEWQADFQKRGGPEAYRQYTGSSRDGVPYDFIMELSSGFGGEVVVDGIRYDGNFYKAMQQHELPLPAGVMIHTGYGDFSLDYTKEPFKTILNTIKKKSAEVKTTILSPAGKGGGFTPTQWIVVGVGALIFIPMLISLLVGKPPMRMR